MADLIVQVSRIDDIVSHDNADLLEVAVVKGWNCIVLKDQYKKVILSPISHQTQSFRKK